jgi:hypothetical protein
MPFSPRPRLAWFVCLLPLLGSGCSSDDNDGGVAKDDDQVSDAGKRTPTEHETDAGTKPGHGDDGDSDKGTKPDAPSTKDEDASGATADDTAAANDDNGSSEHETGDSGSASASDAGADSADDQPNETQPGTDVPPVTGPSPLDGTDGIAVTANGTDYVCTMNVMLDDLGTTFPALGLRAQCDNDEWQLAFPKEPGTYDCAKWTPVDGATYQNAEQSYVFYSPNMSGVIGSDPENGGVCSVTVTSTMGVVEGTFSGSIVSILGEARVLTNGHFYFGDGLGDCSLADDPGLEDGENAATVAITDVQGRTSAVKCGQNFKLTSVLTNYDGSYFSGGNANEDSKLSIEGLTTTGTFACGDPGNPDDPSSKAVTMGWGNGVRGFYYQDCMDSCSIEVTRFDDEIVEGTYTGTFRETCSADAALATFEGHFRAPSKPMLQ